MGTQSSETLVTINPQRDYAGRNMISRLLSIETLGSIIMVVAAIAAIIIANTAAYEWYEGLLNFELGFRFTGFGFEDVFIGFTVEEWVNQVLMTLFFLVVGMEIKYELFVGELKNIRAALLPIIAACGGVIAPIIIYSIFNFGGEHAHGFGIPMATDIAFAIGVLTLVGSGIPRGLSVFLKTLAIADDIMAIVVIAIFYGQSPDLFWLVMAALVVVVLMGMNKARVYTLVPYILFGIVLWFCIFMSGVESTISGVILAFTIPTKSKINPRVFGKWTIAKILEARNRYEHGEPMLAQGEYLDRVNMIHRVSRNVEPPLSRLERKLSPLSNYFILPIFAFFNAGVHLAGVDISSVVTNTVTLGVFFGLWIGKPIGITVASLICVKSGLTPMPNHCGWRHMIGAGMLGGIGFTMSIYVANLSFAGGASDEVTMMAKAAILCASLVSGIVGVAYLKVVLAKDRKNGKAFIEEEPMDDEIRDDIKVLSKISESATDTTMGEGEYLILTNEMGEVSDEELVAAFRAAINEGDSTFTAAKE